MTGASPAVLFRLADALEALEEACEALRSDPGDVERPGVLALVNVVRDLHVAMAMIDPDLDRLAQAAAGILED